MAVSRALRRLLHIRELEEEQQRILLEAALAELDRLQRAAAAAARGERAGRDLIRDGARSGDLTDRQAGLAQAETSAHLAHVLVRASASAQSEAASARADFLAARIERQQAATLIQSIETRDAADAARHTHQQLDDWARRRRPSSQGGRT